eukprot:GGOE01014895.1.p1 GENE.GGOE01014895.1~~GGOE01014895.1.p1  ORF type:complete len:1189 (+),score=319.47 GGOE01014895.1:339-3569(+)
MTSSVLSKTTPKQQKQSECTTNQSATPQVNINILRMTSSSGSCDPPPKKQRIEPSNPSTVHQNELEKELSRKEQALLGHCRLHVRSLFTLVGEQQQQARLRLEECQAARRLKFLKDAFRQAQGIYQGSRRRRLVTDRRCKAAQQLHGLRTTERTSLMNTLKAAAQAHPTLCHVATTPNTLRFLAAVRERAASLPLQGTPGSCFPSPQECEELLSLEERPALLAAVWDCGSIQWLEAMGGVGTSVYTSLRHTLPPRALSIPPDDGERHGNAALSKGPAQPKRLGRFPGGQYNSPVPITGQLKAVLAKLQGSVQQSKTEKALDAVLCPFEMLGHCNDDLCPNLHAQEWPATDQQLLERVWRQMEQRYGAHEMVQKVLQAQWEHCDSWGSMGLHAAFRETMKLFDDVQALAKPNSKGKPFSGAAPSTSPPGPIPSPTTPKDWIALLIEAARAEVSRIPPDMLPIAPLRPSRRFLDLAKRACDACGSSLDSLPPLLLRVFLNAYVAHNLQDVQLRERNTKGWLLKVFDQLLLRHPHNVQVYCLYLEVLSRNCPSLLTVDRMSRLDAPERRQVPTKFIACVKSCLRVLDIAIARFSALNRTILDKESEVFCQTSQTLLYFIGQKCLLLLKDGRHAEAAQYLRALLSEAAEHSVLKEANLATLCAFFFGILGTGAQAGVLQMAACLTGSVIICWDRLLNESSEFLSDLDAIFETMKTHQQLTSGTAELLLLANHVLFLKACGRLDPPTMRTMLHGYLRKTVESSNGWPFYVQMEFLLGQDEDGFHVCDELLGMFHSNVFFFYFYARSLVGHRKCAEAIAILRECIVQFRLSPDSAPEDELARLQTLRQAVKEAVAQESPDALLLYYEQELDAESAVVQPWAWDSNHLFLGLCYLLLCCLEGRQARCLDGFACLLDKCYGSVEREQHWGSTQLIIWEYLQAMIYFEVKLPDVCRAAFRSLRYIVCHNVERDLAMGSAALQGVVVDDVLPSLQLMLGSSHSLAADFTFFNAIVQEVIAYAPPKEHSGIYREALTLDGRNSVLRWRWAKHERAMGNAELAHQLCQELFRTSFLDFLPLCPTPARP